MQGQAGPVSLLGLRRPPHLPYSRPGLEMEKLGVLPGRRPSQGALGTPLQGRLSPGERVLQGQYPGFGLFPS